MAITVEMREQVSQLYVALFGRAPDGEGLGFWVHQLDSGQTLAQVADAMYATAPARDYYPSFLTNGEIIASFYVNVLGREADAEGLAYWTAKLDAAGATPGSVITQMIDVVANYSGTDEAGLQSAALFNNKVTVAEYYGEQNGTIEGATVVLTGVTADPTTVDDAIADIDNGTVGGVQQGETFVLTVDPDTVVGTNGNDTIVVPYSNKLGAEVTTWQAFDKINGGNGDDKMEIYVKGDANISQAGTVDGVEVINVYNSEADGFFGGKQGINAAKFTGVQEIWQIDGFNSVTDISEGTVIGFRGDAAMDGLSLDALGASLNIEFDQEMVGDSSASIYVTGPALTTVDIAGTYTVPDTDDLGNPIVGDGYVELTVVEGTGTKFTLNSSLNVDLLITDSNKFSQVDGSASTGDLYVGAEGNDLQTVTTGSGDDTLTQQVFVTTATKSATYTMGAGDDYASIYTDGTGTTTLDMGDGDDAIDVYGASKTLVLNTGAGDDDIFFSSDFQTQGDVTTKLTANLGTGDDSVDFSNLQMSDLPAAWVLDGGDGTDDVFIGAGIGRTFVAGDYVALTESLKNFEGLHLFSTGEAEDFSIDASRLANYKTIEMFGLLDTDLIVTKAAADQTIGLNSFFGLPVGPGEDTPSLDVTAAGYVATDGVTPTVYGGNVNADVNGSFSYIDMIAQGNTLNLALGAGEDEAVGEDFFSLTAVHGDVKSISATLNAEVVLGEDEAAEPTGVEMVALVIQANDTDLHALTNVTLSGVGEVFVSNSGTSKLATVDASGLTGLAWDSVGMAAVTGDALVYSTDNAGTAETVKLSAGYDHLQFYQNNDGPGTLWGSTYLKTDKVEGLTLVATSADVATLDTAKSDSLYVQSYDSFSKLSSTQAATVSAASSLGLALQTVAQSAVDYAVFQYGGNTYIYGDTGGLIGGTDLDTAANNQVDDSDLLIQLAGNIDLDLLVQALEVPDPGPAVGSFTFDSIFLPPIVFEV